MTRITVKPSGRALGADIEGIDLSQPLDEKTFEEIHKAWAEHLVLRNAVPGRDAGDCVAAQNMGPFPLVDVAPWRYVGGGGDRDACARARR